MTLLTDYAEAINSQFGEDGIIRECLTRMGLINQPFTALEVGASDGRECSNTLALRDNWGWHRILIEADPVLFTRQEFHTHDVSILRAITWEGSNSLDELCTPKVPAFLSLDIDGDDYRVLLALKMQPELICAEFNQTIPWAIDIYGPQLGCSLRALTRLMSIKGYCFLGATECNAFFVPDKYLSKFHDINRDPSLYLSDRNFTYLVTTPYGGSLALGPQVFGVQKRFVGELNVVTPDGATRTITLGPDSSRPQ